MSKEEFSEKLKLVFSNYPIEPSLNLCCVAIGIVTRLKIFDSEFFLKYINRNKKEENKYSGVGECFGGKNLNISSEELFDLIGSRCIIPLTEFPPFDAERNFLLDSFKGEFEFSCGSWEWKDSNYEVTWSEIVLFLRRVDELSTPKSETKNKTTKEEVMKMETKKLMENFMPSKVKKGEVSLTIDGKTCIKRKNGDYVSFNESKRTIENQMGLVLGDSVSKMFYFMPTQTLVSGDIYKDGEDYFVVVENVDADMDATYCVNLSEGTETTSVVETNILLGGKYYKKLVNLFASMNGAEVQGLGAMGQMNPMMMMMMMDKDGDGWSGSDDSDSMMKMMMMSQMMGGAQGQMGQIGQMNPMMIMMMMDGNDGDDSMMKMMMMSQMMGTNIQK